MRVVAARKARGVFTPLRLNDARHRNASVNKSQVQALETTLDLAPSLEDFDVSRLSKCKCIATWLGKNWMQYSASHVYSYYALLLSSNGLRSNPEHENFLRERAPRPPYSCMFMHTHIQTRHPCNPPSKNPGYVPGDCGLMPRALLIKP